VSEDLKKRTINSFKWSFIEKFISFVFSFLVGILIARVLSPSDYGVMGLIVVFVSLSQIILDGGFSLALIQKKDATEDEYSSVFFLNILLAVILYAVVFFLSSFVADFYSISGITLLMKVVGLNILVNAFSIVQTAKLTKELNIKLQSKISLFVLLISGSIALVLVYNDFGIWTLVFQTLIKNVLNMSLLWWFSSWRPKMVLKFSSVSPMLRFSGNVLSLGILGVLYDNMFSMIIGKVHSTKEVGYYSKANQIQQMPLSIYTSSLTKILLPILSEADLSQDRLKRVYSEFIVVSAMIVTPVMFIISALSEPLVIWLFTEKWKPMIPYLKIMSIYGIFYPLIAINLNLLLVKNKSGLCLALDIIKFLLAFVLLFAVRESVIDLLIGFSGFYVFGYFLHAWISSDLIGYRMKDQLKDIFRPFLFSFLTYIVVLFCIDFFSTNALKIFVGGVFGCVFYCLVNFIFNRPNIDRYIHVLNTLRAR
jgi:teichuronic acid exporter